MLLSGMQFGPSTVPPALSLADRIGILVAIASVGIVLFRVAVNMFNRFRRKAPSYRTDSLLWCVGCLLVGTLATAIDVYSVTRVVYRKGLQLNNFGALIVALGEALIPLIFALSASLILFFIAALSKGQHNRTLPPHQQERA